MAFLDKLNDLAKNIGAKTNDAIETTKLSSKISAERSAAGEDMKKIGQHYYAKYAAGESVDPEVLEFCVSAAAHDQSAAEAQAEIDRIRAENEAAKAAAAAPVVPPASAGVPCPACGSANAAGTRFCCSCGAKLEAEKRPCPACGAELAPNAKFCNSCGAKVE